MVALAAVSAAAGVRYKDHLVTSVVLVVNYIQLKKLG